MLDYEIIATSAEMSSMDREATIALDITMKDLMHNAAKAFCDALLEDELFENTEKILILCGNGNNGGDGYAAARILADKGYDIAVYTVEPDKGRSKAAQYWFEKCFANKKINLAYDIDRAFKNTDMIIDAVYGTGFRDEFNEQVADVYKKVATIDTKKVAIDAPSGIVMDTPRACEHAFKADLTITFEFLKYGLVSKATSDYVGRVKLVSIGFPKEIREKMMLHGRRYILLDPLASFKRNPEANKGDFGKLLMVCASKTMTGAGYFSAMGALRTGVGLLYFSCPENTMQVMQTKLNEPVFLPYEEMNIDSFVESIGDIKKYTAILHGCGVGNNEHTLAVNKYLLQNSKAPVVFDADAINALIGNLDILKKKKCKLVLTPHPLEMARLINKDVVYVQENRMLVAREFAKEYDCAVILKGAKTVIAMPEGKVYVNATMNAGMAKGGTGDILAGMVSSLLAQKFSMAKALCSAVFRHGASGDSAREVFGESAMLPSDMLNYLR